MPELRRAEVWTSYQCDSGTRVAIVAKADISALSYTERVTREDLLQLTVPKASAGAAEIIAGRVLRLLFVDDDFTEWRIHSVSDASGAEGGVVRVVCRSVLFEWRDAALLTTTTGTAVTLGRRFDGVDAAAVVAQALLELPAYWSAGTITPTVVVSFEETEGSWLTALRSCVVKCIAAGVPCELDWRRNGVVGYFIDIVSAIGSGAVLPDVRTGKNLLTSERQRSRDEMVTRIYPLVGGVPALPLAYVRVTSVAGSDIELRQAETGAPIVAFDNQFVGAYLENDAGTRTLITASVAATSKVTVASAAGFAANEWTRLCASAAGLDLINLDVPGAAVKVGVFEAGGDLVTNLVDNPFLSRWPGSTSAAPPGFSTTLGTVSRNSNAAFIRRGLYSMRLQFAAGISGRTDLVNVAPGRGVIYSAKITAYIAAGNLALTLRNQLNANLATTTVGVGWTEYEVTGLNIGAATGLYWFFSTGLAGSDVYIDSAQICWGAAQSAWSQGSGASVALTRGNAALVENGTTPTRYSLTIADLERLAPADFPYDALTVGAVLRITDRELGIVALSRIMEITRNMLNPAATVLVLERQSRSFSRTLAVAA